MYSLSSILLGISVRILVGSLWLLLNLICLIMDSHGMVLVLGSVLVIIYLILVVLSTLIRLLCYTT